MKCITGALYANEGEIFVDDANIQQNPEETKMKIGFLAENNPLYYEMYVREYLKFVAQLRKVPSARIEEVIEEVGLEIESHKKIGQLSKGYKQRVGLAQAIISSPEILILDEPTNGLDPNQILEIRELIKKLGAEKTVILSTHIMQEVEALCSRVILLNRGEIIADQPIEEFKGQYENLEEAFHQLTQVS
ncbi:unnamed protein product, partial [Cyprideis torosa]